MLERVNDFSFYDCSCPFCFLLIELKNSIISCLLLLYFVPHGVVDGLYIYYRCRLVM